MVPKKIFCVFTFKTTPTFASNCTTFFLSMKYGSCRTVKPLTNREIKYRFRKWLEFFLVQVHPNSFALFCSMMNIICHSYYPVVLADSNR